MIDNLISWRRMDGTIVSGSLYDTVEQLILRELEQGHKLKICIGTDSQVNCKQVDYATVIVFLREKKGGFMLIHDETRKHIPTLKERMILEVGMSVDVAYRICDLLDRYGVALEVHADINTDPAFPSHSALSEAMGYILGMGFVFKAKPEAFASSYCADKIVS